MNKEVFQPGTINLAFVENLYANYLRDPSSVSADWQEYFGELLWLENLLNTRLSLKQLNNPGAVGLARGRIVQINHPQSTFRYELDSRFDHQVGSADLQQTGFPENCIRKQDVGYISESVI